MLKKILVAYDEGRVSERALDKAIELAKSTGGEIYILSVYMSVDNPTRREHLEKIQLAAAEKVSKEGIAVNRTIEAGGKVLGKTIAKVAEDLKVDVVIMGTNNRGAVGQFMFGSVSKYVLRNLGLPVMIIK